MDKTEGILRVRSDNAACHPKPRAKRAFGEGWRRGWDSQQGAVLIRKKLRPFHSARSVEIAQTTGWRHVSRTRATTWVANPPSHSTALTAPESVLEFEFDALDSFQNRAARRPFRKYSSTMIFTFFAHAFGRPFGIVESWHRGVLEYRNSRITVVLKATAASRATVARRQPTIPPNLRSESCNCR